MKKINYIKSSEKRSVININLFKTVGISILFMLFMAVVSAFLSYKMKMSIGSLIYVSQVVFYITFAFCGFISAKFNVANGWKNGAVSSFMLLLVILVIGMVDGINFELSNLFRIILALFIGAAGGVFGVNYAYSRKNKSNKKHRKLKNNIVT